MFLINFIFIIASRTGKDRYETKHSLVFTYGLSGGEQNALQSGVGEGRLKCSAVGLFDHSGTEWRESHKDKAAEL